jgi:hypothetical protein
MQDRGVRPNEITFICVLGACARAGSGLVGVTKEIFRTMPTVHGVEPEVEHYGSMVDVLGRAGLLAEAVGEPPQTTERSWASILAVRSGLH